MIMNQADADLVAWRCFDDTVRRWLPAMNTAMLGAVVFDLRNAPGAVWRDLPPELDRQRELLLLDVLAAFERLTGEPWPILGDKPECPDSPADLVN
jgi:hypothetical protein